MTTVVSIEGLSKKYLIRHQRTERYLALRDLMASKFREVGGFLSRPFSKLRARAGDQSAKEDFWALKDVSFKVNQGERMGIIGRNGAGKSTLLKILSRITAPTNGRISIKGKVASLLEVGTGFHPELTGRETFF